MPSLGTLYAEGRSRFLGVVDDLDEGQSKTAVPTCPDWSVKDVLAHVTGICGDILGGNLDGVATEPWTAAQVEARRDRSLAEIAGEWRQTGPQIDAIVDQFGRSGEQLLLDLTSHEFDVRLALRRPGPRDAAVMPIAADFIVTMTLDRALRDRGVGPIEVVADDQAWVVGGDGEPAATLTTGRFELIRALTGRRSARQVAAMPWSSDPAPYVPAFQSGPFTFSPTDVEESTGTSDGEPVS